VAEVVESLPSKCKDLSEFAKKKKKEKEGKKEKILVQL
jgi:hypothetical protein